MVPAVGGSGQHLTDDEKFAESFERALIRADAFLASRPELDDESMSAMLLSVRR